MWNRRSLNFDLQYRKRIYFHKIFSYEKYEDVTNLKIENCCWLSLLALTPVIDEHFQENFCFKQNHSLDTKTLPL